MNRFTLLFCISTYLLVGSEAALDAEGIVGGELAPPDEYVYQISLQKGDKHLCGGAIIDNQHILTAAHCVTDASGDIVTSSKTTVAGAHDLADKGPDAVTIYVEKIYIPKNYTTKSNESDIAVLKLEVPLDLEHNKHLRKLELPKDNSQNYLGVNATVTGYGWTWTKIRVDRWTGELVEAGGTATKQKKFAIAKVLSTAECQNDYPQETISDNQICARVHQRYLNGFTEGICSGDSGSPLVYNNSVIIGVVEGGAGGCDESRSPGIYTRVSAYLDFIKNATADRETSSMRVYDLHDANILEKSRTFAPLLSVVLPPPFSFIPFFV